MSIPAWKQAVIDRRKKQEEEERKKQEQEEQYLSSLPPWKRAIVLRNREKSGASVGVTQKTPAATPSAANKSTPQSTKPNQWQAAVQVSVASSPTRQRPPWARTSSPNSNSPRRTRSNLWEKGSTSSNSPTVSTRRVKSFNVSDKQPVSTTALSILQQRRSSVVSDPEESSPQNIPKFNSQAKVSPFQSNASSSVDTAPSEESVHLRKKVASSVKIKESIEEKRRSFENEAVPSATEKRLSFEKDTVKPPSTTTTDEDPALANMPAWKKAIILRRRQQQAGASSQEKKEVQQPTESQEKISAPKKVAQSRPAVGVDETDSPAVDNAPTEITPKVQESPSKKSAKKSTKSKAKTGSKSTSGSKDKQDLKGTKRVKKAESKPKQPEIVNREPVESGSGKLVTQEGVTLHPPVYKEVEQWANVLETDEKFLSLPPWKQALIKRRRADIAKRSGQNAPPTEENKPKTSAEPEKPVHTAWSPRNSVDIQNNTSTAPNWKQELLRKRKATPPPNKIIPEEKIITGTPSSGGGSSSSTVQSLLGRFSSSKSNTDNKQTQQQQQHRVVNVGEGESSDSELEDVTVTCIDEEESSSDEDDSGIDKGKAVRTHSAPTTPTAVSPTGTLTRISSKSILAEPGKKSYRKMRRVSFSDSQLTVEHSYPKYDYKDYDGVNHEGHEDGGLSQKIHPSLRQNDDFGRYGSPSGNKLSGWTPSLTGYGDLLLQQLAGNFNSPPTSPTKTSSGAKESTDSSGDDTANDFYANLNPDTAALLW